MIVRKKLLRKIPFGYAFIALTLTLSALYYLHNSAGISAYTSLISISNGIENRLMFSQQQVGYDSNSSRCDAYLLILSKASANESRASIRAGWLADLKGLRNPLALRHKFIIGHQKRTKNFRETYGNLKEEMDSYDDILILPFVDSYFNLTVKVSLLFKTPSVLNQCRYLVKLDEDVYVRAERFTSMIRGLPVSLPIYGGYFYDQKKRTMAVNREVGNKFSFTLEEYPNFYFNQYVGGPIYFMTNDVALRLPYKVLKFTRSNGDEEYVPDTYLDPNRPVIYRLEDVYMGYLIGTMEPKVTFWHIAKLILDFDHKREKAQVALHNVREPNVMIHGKEILG